MDWIKKHKVLTVVIVLVLLFAVAGASGDQSKNQQSNSNDSAAKEEPEKKEESSKVSLQEFYDKVQNGQTKEEVAALDKSREASNCSTYEDQYIGKTETCNYGGFSDGGFVTVTFTNGKVSSKAQYNN